MTPYSHVCTHNPPQHNNIVAFRAVCYGQEMNQDSQPQTSQEGDFLHTNSTCNTGHWLDALFSSCIYHVLFLHTINTIFTLYLAEYSQQFLQEHSEVTGQLLQLISYDRYWVAALGDLTEFLGQAVLNQRSNATVLEESFQQANSRRWIWYVVELRFL